MTIITTDSTAVRPNILIRKRQAGFAFMILDAAGSINMLSSSVMDEFEERIEEAASDPSIKAIGIISGKPESFLLGADLHEILKFTMFLKPRNCRGAGKGCSTDSYRWANQR